MEAKGGQIVAEDEKGRRRKERDELTLEAD